MPQIYTLRADGSAIPMPKVRCRDEVSELQDLLEKNLELLPGDQIQPEDPRRWLIIKREMPVPDPESGPPRWAIDFVLVDQDAIPTFVECKRFADTRSRREVVAQMLEYAANGYAYWDREIFQHWAEQRAHAQGTSLKDELQKLVGENEVDLEDFFGRMEENLRQGNIRLVFFLEEAPTELKSIVDFLNKQMERTEVLLVEARLYELDGTRIIVPTLFGYTEEARRIKRTVTPTSRRFWNEETFFEAVASNLGDEILQSIYELFTIVRSRGFRIRWGTGGIHGSFNVIAPHICPRSLFTVRTTGSLILNFGWLDSSEQARRFREEFGKVIQEQLGWELPPNYPEKYPSVSPEVWLPQSRKFVDVVSRLVDDFVNVQE
ncbi:MAG: hypothetical protein GXO55_08415 [Chloroflexi bacterium]|nr:hypothetical protein [Chloroflexota bacterium]